MRRTRCFYQFCMLVPMFYGFAFSVEWINFSSRNQINAITHFGDSIWLGTYQGGLMLIDAKTDKMTVYNKGNSELAENSMNVLAVDSTGGLFLGSRMFQILRGTSWKRSDALHLNGHFISGLSVNGKDVYCSWDRYLRKFDGAQWDSLAIGSILSSSFNIHSILPVGNDSIWVGASDGLYIVKNFSSFEKILSESINSLVRDNNGTIFCGTTYNGLKKLYGAVWTTFDTSNCNIPGQIIYCMKFDSNNRLWLGTDAGLASFDGSTWSVYDTANSDVPDNTLFSIDIDNNGRIWIGTRYGGAASFDKTAWKTCTESGLIDNSCYSVALDNSNNPWISHGSGVGYFNGSEWKHYGFSSPQTPPEPFRLIYSDSAYKIIADSHVALSLKKSNECYAVPLSRIGACGRIIRDKNGLVWAAINGRLCTYDGTKWQQVNSPGFPVPATSVVMACGFDGTMYIAGEDPQDSCVLVSFDGQNWKTLFRCLQHFPDTSFVVSALAIDSENRLWAGICDHARAGKGYGGGIRRYGDGTWDSFTIDNSGIPGNTVWCLQFDGAGNLWAGGSEGLVKYDGNSWTVYNILNSGLPDNFVDGIAVDSIGNKWIAVHFGGLTLFREGGVILPTGTAKPTPFQRENGLVRHPAVCSGVLSFSVLKGCFMEVKISDIAGRRIAALPRQWYDLRTHHIPLSKSLKARSGVVIITFSAPGFIGRSLLIQKN